MIRSKTFPPYHVTNLVSLLVSLLVALLGSLSALAFAAPALATTLLGSLTSLLGGLLLALGQGGGHLIFALRAKIKRIDIHALALGLFCIRLALDTLLIVILTMVVTVVHLVSLMGDVILTTGTGFGRSMLVTSGHELGVLSGLNHIPPKSTRFLHSISALETGLVLHSIDMLLCELNISNLLLARHGIHSE